MHVLVLISFLCLLALVILSAIANNKYNKIMDMCNNDTQLNCKTEISISNLNMPVIILLGMLSCFLCGFYYVHRSLYK